VRIHPKSFWEGCLPKRDYNAKVENDSEEGHKESMRGVKRGSGTETFLTCCGKAKQGKERQGLNEKGPRLKVFQNKISIRDQAHTAGKVKFILENGSMY